MAASMRFASAGRTWLASDLREADMAEQMGLINRAIPDELLDAYVDRLARQIANLPPGVARASVGSA